MKRTDIQFVVGVLLLSVLSLTAAIAFVYHIYTFVALSLLLLFFVAAMLYHILTKTNKRMAHFLSSLRNSDLSVSVPDENASKTARLLAEEMNHIAGMIRRKNAESEEKSLYYESILKVMTHELRNAVTPVSSLSSFHLSRKSCEGNPDLREDLEIIYEQSKGMENLLKAYHQLAHLPEPQLTTIEPATFFKRIERQIQNEPGHEKVRFDTSVTGTFQGDPNLLTLLFFNLIRNALQAIEGVENGVVLVRLNEKHPNLIHIIDNGAGILPNLLTSVFTPFFSTKNTGSGIGLSISRRIMQLHGGEITVASRPGETVFTLRFP